MTLTNTARRERINLRISEAAKRRIEQAASVEGKTPDFNSLTRPAATVAAPHEEIVMKFKALRAPARGATSSPRNVSTVEIVSIRAPVSSSQKAPK